MIRPMSSSTASELSVVVHPRAAIAARLQALTAYVRSSAPVVPLGKHPAWLNVLRAALDHEVYALEAVAGGQTYGFLPLAHISSMLFGRFLVSLPYLNTNGVVAESADVQARLVSRAVTLADELNVRYLELRHEQPVDHPDLSAAVMSKVHMRLPLPRAVESLWKGFDPKVRNQVRKGEKAGFAVAWGGAELLDGFYEVLSRNMRDLGTPVYAKALFRETLAAFPADAEICLVRAADRPAAAALLLHGWGVTEVPTAAALREYNPSCVNMLMYWKLLERSVGRGQQLFDFGRSTTDGSTFKFKKQWGAVPHPAVWQYAVKEGAVTDMRPDNPRYQRAIRLWQRLPVRLTQYLGPAIVRGIP
ncbi:MAG: family N-acetyltransferase [Gemmataceae bacterium]|nr:family N-acetyltransferase [Gemmataceae bacterium]